MKRPTYGAWMRPHWLGFRLTVLLFLAPAARADEAPPVRKPVAGLPSIGSLPSPFAFQDGTTVKTREDWSRRRLEIRSLFETYVYGQLPPKPEKMTVVKEEPEADAKNGID